MAGAGALTHYAVLTRYPLEVDEVVTPAEHRRAVDTAEAVLRWAEEVIGRSSGSGTAESGRG